MSSERHVNVVLHVQLQNNYKINQLYFARRIYGQLLQFLAQWKAANLLLALSDPL